MGAAMYSGEPKERFSVDWLALREAADTRARSASVLAAVRAWAADRTELAVLDLGCGSGANLRYLCPRLSASQRWCCIDHDEALIGRLLASQFRPPQLETIETRIHALADFTYLDTVGPDTLVTASALLDLVSAPWLAGLIERCRTRSPALLLALTYDGRVEIEPPHTDDRLVIALFNAHQRGDKGLGPALGPDAAGTLRVLADARGYEMTEGESDWLLGPDQAMLARELLAGWATAAAARAPAQRDRIRDWHQERRRAIRSRRFEIRVGHRDAFLVP